MLSKKTILDIARKRGKLRTVEIAGSFGVSRQYANTLIGQLVDEGRLIKIGSTRSAFYVSPEYASTHTEIFPNQIEKYLENSQLEEHKVLDYIENHFPLLLKLPENIRSILSYAFSEMLNNAIEHSGSERIYVKVTIINKKLTFIVDDFGVGVFRNIMQKKYLKSELEAVQDLLKGKTTTMPKAHSGEGIFFTSRASDIFILDSFGKQLTVNNDIKDVFFQQSKKSKRGTRVVFTVRTDSLKHLRDIFGKYSNIDEDTGLPAFDKTEVKIKLYTVGGVHVSRSQARRVLSGLEKFKAITFDFLKVPMVGQAFADEVFRVFHNKHPDIKLRAINMNEAVKFMVDRVEGNNPRTPDLFGGSL